MDGVAPQLSTVEMVDRANVSQKLHLPNQPQPQPLEVVVVAVLAASFASLYSTNRLNIAKMGAAPVTGSIPTMLSSLQADLSNIESLRKCPLNIQTFVTRDISVIGWQTMLDTSKFHNLLNDRLRLLQQHLYMSNATTKYYRRT